MLLRAILLLLLIHTQIINALTQHPVLPHPSPSPYLHLSAIINQPHPPYHATIECWALTTTPFHPYPTIGFSLPLADISNLTYVTLPPRSSEGLHHPPHPMLFILLAGEAHVTLPDGNPEGGEGLWIREGTTGAVVVATDTLGVGHNTTYPGEKWTVAIQAPFRHGVVPEHVVIGEGPCPDSVG